MRGITWKRCLGGFEGFVKDPKYNNKAIFSAVLNCFFEMCDVDRLRAES